MKIITRITLLLIIPLLFSTTFFVSPVQSIPSNKAQCNTCHSVGGFGTIAATSLDGTKPENNNFNINKGETIIISLQALGANEESEPAVALIFDTQIHHHISIEGASIGGEGSYAFYVKDGDENDQDSDPGHVKGVFEITVDITGEPGIYDVIATFVQEGPSGITVGLILNVEGVARKTSSISMIVSPSNVYANKDKVFISGSIRPSNAEQLSISYKTEDLWQVIELITPTPDGLFFYEWEPEEINDYNIKVQFEGDEEFTSVESDIFNVKVLKSPQSLNTEIIISVMLAMGAMLIFSVLFYLAGRTRYNKRIARKNAIQ